MGALGVAETEVLEVMKAMEVFSLLTFRSYRLKPRITPQNFRRFRTSKRRFTPFGGVLDKLHVPRHSWTQRRATYAQARIWLPNLSWLVLSDRG